MTDWATTDESKKELQQIQIRLQNRAAAVASLLDEQYQDADAIGRIQNEMISCLTKVAAAVAETFTCVYSNPAAARAIMEAACGHRPCDPLVAVGNVRDVSSVVEFQDALALSSDGDHIRFLPGTYNDIGVVEKTGSASIAITGVGAVLTGASKIYVNGSNTTVFGFKTLGGNQRYHFEVESTADDCRILCNEIDLPISSGASYDVGIMARGKRCEIADNHVHNTPFLFFPCFNDNGTSPGAEDGWIHHNTFKDSINTGTNGASALRVGLLGQYIGTRVEFNRFDNWMGDGETVELKGSGIEFFHNYSTNSGFGHTSNRWGDDNVIYGNYSDSARWNVRINGNRNKVYFNYAKSQVAGFFSAFQFFLTDSETSNARNVGAFDNVVKCNISEGFRYWNGTLAQGPGPYTNVSGNVVSDNIYLNTGEVGTAANYLADDGVQPWADFDANNTHTGNELLDTFDAGQNAYCALAPLQMKGTVDGFAPPIWWAAMFPAS